MNEHAELLRGMITFHAALTDRFKWFIHETPYMNLSSIQSKGLLPMRDALPPAEVASYFESSAVPILCLHPHGSKLIPRGAANGLVVPIGGLEPKRLKLAVSSRDLPTRVGLDWSYAWELQEARVQGAEQGDLDFLGCEVADEFGSIISYDPISPSLLRVCTAKTEFFYPEQWPFFNDVGVSEIALFD